MEIPEAALIYYLGENYGKLKMPEFIKGLQDKGVKVDGTMTFNKALEVVKETYAKRT